jgi:DNA invertase Pin-like site-specific DNA recombinase
MLHANINGRIKRNHKIGEDSKLSKLNNEKVLEIRRLHSETRAVTNIAKMFGIGKTHVQRIVNRKSWAHI